MTSEINDFSKFFINSFESLMEAYFAKINPEDFFFIQIGANDGVAADPLNKFIKKFDIRKGILIEPQKIEFEALRKNYEDRMEFIFENVAISIKNEEKELYRIAFSQSKWATGLTSFNKESIQHHIKCGYVKDCSDKEGLSLPSNRDDYITSDTIQCMTFHDLIHKHDVSKIDLLQIDVEGYDYEIIKSIPFDKIQPKIIHYENKNLSKEDNLDCKKFLESKGYVVLFYHWENAVAIRNNLFNISSLVVK